jgi:hypothetical protein
MHPERRLFDGSDPGEGSLGVQKSTGAQQLVTRSSDPNTRSLGICWLCVHEPWWSKPRALFAAQNGPNSARDDGGARAEAVTSTGSEEHMASEVVRIYGKDT